LSLTISLQDLKNKINFFGDSAKVDELLQTVSMVAPTDLSVLIHGESGTGKEVIAMGIHQMSLRFKKPQISVNCGAIPEGILESELFGHEKGSFTGAIEQKKGYFEAANGGTIFLDEIGEMPLNTQVKLLRVLESSEFMRVGGTVTHKVDVRVIAATNKDLEHAVANNEFRRDLYYRLKAIQIKIPALRERVEDIPQLVEIFARNYTEKNNIRFKGFAPEAILLLKEYAWPGNVRELRNFIETAIILNRGEIVHSAYVRSSLNLYPAQRPSDFLPIPLNKTPEQAERELIYRTLIALKLDINEIKENLNQMIYRTNGQFGAARTDAPSVGSSAEVKPQSLNAMERNMIKETLNRFNGNRRKTARALQISERTLYRKIKEFGL